MDLYAYKVFLVFMPPLLALQVGFTSPDGTES